MLLQVRHSSPLHLHWERTRELMSLVAVNGQIVIVFF